MRTTNSWDSLLKSLRSLWDLLLDNMIAVAAFVIVGIAALLVHKSVEKLQVSGVPSNLIEGMELLDVCMWGIDALSVLCLCGVAAIKLCNKVIRG